MKTKKLLKKVCDILEGFGEKEPMTLEVNYYEKEIIIKLEKPYIPPPPFNDLKSCTYKTKRFRYKNPPPPPPTPIYLETSHPMSFVPFGTIGITPTDLKKAWRDVKVKSFKEAKEFIKETKAALKGGSSVKDLCRLRKAAIKLGSANEAVRKLGYPEITMTEIKKIWTASYQKAFEKLGCWKEPKNQTIPCCNIDILTCDHRFVKNKEACCDFIDSAHKLCSHHEIKIDKEKGISLEGFLPIPTCIFSDAVPEFLKRLREKKLAKEKKEQAKPEKPSFSYYCNLADKDTCVQQAMHEGKKICSATPPCEKYSKHIYSIWCVAPPMMICGAQVVHNECNYCTHEIFITPCMYSRENH